MKKELIRIINKLPVRLTLIIQPVEIKFHTINVITPAQNNLIFSPVSEKYFSEKNKGMNAKSKIHPGKPSHGRDSKIPETTGKINCAEFLLFFAFNQIYTEQN